MDNIHPLLRWVNKTELDKMVIQSVMHWITIIRRLTVLRLTFLSAEITYTKTPSKKDKKWYDNSVRETKIYMIS